MLFARLHFALTWVYHCRPICQRCYKSSVSLWLAEVTAEWSQCRYLWSWQRQGCLVSRYELWRRPQPTGELLLLCSTIWISSCGAPMMPKRCGWSTPVNLCRWRWHECHAIRQTSPPPCTCLSFARCNTSAVCTPNTKIDKYECAIDQELAESRWIGAGQTFRIHSIGGSTFLCEMSSWPPSWKYDVKSKIRLRQSSILAKFHHDRMWNNGTLKLFKRRPPHRKQQ